MLEEILSALQLGEPLVNVVLLALGAAIGWLSRRPSKYQQLLQAAACVVDAIQRYRANTSDKEKKHRALQELSSMFPEEDESLLEKALEEHIQKRREFATRTGMRS